MSVTQSEFRAALLDSNQKAPAGLEDALARPAGRRFDVYRNNVAVSLTEAMHQAFPVIAKLLGRQNMDGLAGIYLRRHPPNSPLMMHYGEDFPAFLSGMEQLAHLGYLADVARLELALRRSYHAADGAELPPDALTLTPEDLMRSSFRFAPAVEVVRSPWPIHAIWLFNTATDAPKPQAESQDVVITRPEYDPQPLVLPAGGADLIDALRSGQTLAEAYEKVVETTPEFDLSFTLALLLQGNAITSLTLERLET
ncbi:MAG: DNA-binding domain-containing protein [Pseudomonadota bacterium]